MATRTLRRTSDNKLFTFTPALAARIDMQLYKATEEELKAGKALLTEVDEAIEEFEEASVAPEAVAVDVAKLNKQELIDYLRETFGLDVDGKQTKQELLDLIDEYSQGTA